MRRSGGSSGYGRLLLVASVLAVLVSSVAVTQSLRGAGDNEPEDERPGYEPPGDAPSDDERPTFESPPGALDYAPGRVIVKFKEDVTPEEKAAVRSEEGLTRLEELDLISAEVDQVEGQSVEEAVRNLERRPEVEYAEPDYIVYPAETGSGPEG